MVGGTEKVLQRKAKKYSLFLRNLCEQSDGARWLPGEVERCLVSYLLPH